MQAARGLRKLGIEMLCAVLLAAPLASYAGGLKITIRLGDPAAAGGFVSYRGSHFDYFYALPLVGAAAAPREAPRPSRHHLGLSDGGTNARVLASGAVAIDDRTFVIEGVYYRLAGAEPLALGTPESIAARERLQARLDAGGFTLRAQGVEPSGIRVVSLAP